MTTLAVDGLSEEDFRRSIENRLREGKPHQALERLRRLIAPFAGEGRILPERFATVTADDLVLTGWEGLDAAIARHEKPDRPITALSISFGWPGDEPPQPDAQGRLKPLLEVGYFTDDSYPFSQSDREDLLEGYSFHGCTWAADHEAADAALELEGIDDLHGTLALLEAKLLESELPDSNELLAGSLGACLLSVLLHQAVEAKIASAGLPRPLCVTAGSSGVYPYFDAPVVGFPEEARLAAEAEADELEARNAVPAPRFSSLLVVGIPRAKKRAVLVLEENEAETADRIAKLRGLNHAEPPPEPAPETYLPEVTPELAASSPLLTKKNPGHAWDFRDLLGPREPADGLADELPSEPVDHLFDEQWTAAPDETVDDPVPPAPFDPGETGFDPLGEGWPELPQVPVDRSFRKAPVDLSGPEPELPAEDQTLPVEQPATETRWPEPEPTEASVSEPAADEPAEALWLEPAEEEPETLPEPPRYIPGTDELAEPGFTSLGPSVQDQLARLMGSYAQQPAPIETTEPEPAALAEPDPEDPNAYTGPFWPGGYGWFEDEVEEEAEAESEPVTAPAQAGLWARLRAMMRRV